MNIDTRADLVLALILSVLVAGCAEQTEPQTVVRPVRVFTIGDPQAAGNGESYAGEVKARFETKLAFRVPGKVVARRVEVGDRVQKGQLLAQLDSADYRLAVQSLASQLAGARAERNFSKDDLVRYRELLELNYISRAEYDRHETEYKTADDRVDALRYQLNQANNQFSYTNLYADRNGVVTWLDFETGQVVSAGQVIIKIAQLDDKEVVISVPEQRIAGLRDATRVTVSLWADGDSRFTGRIREISPSADPASRTYTVKVSLLSGAELARLGMTATVYFPPQQARQPTVPLSAVFQPQDAPSQTRVWLVNKRTRTVKSVPVKIGKEVSDDQVTVYGLALGQSVVSAGANRLLEGQNVKILGGGDASTLAQSNSDHAAESSASYASREVK
ncbi:MAG TPA: efflux RND transporter periplasmic adaptor subunit [Burkholderiales bacterium]|nr:efflux RND transporter periplasmic adaptor subunit [Burkholderiales bacterium]